MINTSSVKSIYIVGIIVLSVLSILGLVYITKASFTSDSGDDKDDCKVLNKTEKGISRLTTVLLWIQIAWIVVGAIIQTIWFDGLFKDN